MRKCPTNLIELLCSKCGNTTIPIQRSTNKTPRLLESQKLWCPCCNSYTLQYIIKDKETITGILNSKDELTPTEEKVYDLLKKGSKTR